MPAARQRPATAKAPDAAPPAAKRQTSMSVLLARRSAEVEAGPASAETAEEPKALDIDAADRLDNRAASEYASHIFSYFHRVEPMFRVSPSYMGKQVRSAHLPATCTQPLVCTSSAKAVACRLTSMRRCVPSWWTGWWRCTSSSR